MGDINSCPIAYGREIAEKTVVPNKAGDLIKFSVQVVFIKKNQNAPSVTVLINYSVHSDLNLLSIHLKWKSV